MNTARADAIELHLLREGARIRVSAFERSAGQNRPVKHYEDIPYDEQHIDKLCADILALLGKANRRGDIAPDIIQDIRKAGQVLYDELFTPGVKQLLRSSSADQLILNIDDHLVHIPWELLHDGQEFLSLKFGMGRVVSTRQPIAGDQRRRSAGPVTMLIIADPQGNLDAAYKEGVTIRDALSEGDEAFTVSFVSTAVGVEYVKMNLHDYDIVHYAGHADYDPSDPLKSGWLLENGKWTASDVMRMAGGAPLPFLVFSNACHSGRTDPWTLGNDSQERIYGLANAFLLSGVSHYIGTFWEVLDSPSSDFAVEFYRSLNQATPIGTAVTAARRRLVEMYGMENIIWASYMLYGDPTQKLPEFAESTGADPQAGKTVIAAENRTRGITVEGISLETTSDSHRKRPAFLIFVGLLLTVLLALVFAVTRQSNPPPGTPPTSERTLPAAVTSPEKEPLELSVNIIGQREETDGSVSEILVREGSVLRSSDNFQVHFKTNRDAYVYILLFDSTHEAGQLFPDPKIPLSNRAKAAAENSVPPASQWFWLDDKTGIETIYVLASESPLDEIQRLLREMAGAAKKQRKEASEKIREEIKIVERGVGGITEGKAKSFKLKDGKVIQSVTEIVRGTGAVVRAVSFRHIDNRSFKEAASLPSASPKPEKQKAPKGALVRSSASSIRNMMTADSGKAPDPATISNRMENIKKKSALEETRGVGGIKVYKEAAPAVVLIATRSGIGSGSVIDRQGHVITNWHVVGDHDRVVVFFKPEKSAELTKEDAYTAKVVKVDQQTDLALLKIEHPPKKLPLIKMGTIAGVEVAQEVHAIGHPEGEIWTYTKGIISQIRPAYEWSYDIKIKHRSKVIQTQTPINPGNSGGPLLNNKGEVIGVNSFVKRGEGLNFAVSVDVIQSFLQRKESRIVQKAAADNLLKNVKYYEHDTNKDGIVDVVGADTDGNGKIDLYIVDRDQDEVADFIGVDRDENGKIEAKIFDLDKDGKFESWAIDADEDGEIDLYGLDLDGDGKIDKYIEP